MPRGIIEGSTAVFMKEGEGRIAMTSSRRVILCRLAIKKSCGDQGNTPFILKHSRALLVLFGWDMLT